MRQSTCVCLFALLMGVLAEFEVPPASQISNQDVSRHLNALSLAQWQGFVSSGLDSINRQKRLEENLLKSEITVQNGSVSHAQLLDTLPNQESKEDCDIALKILKSSLFVYNTQCVPHGFSGDDCRIYLEDKPLPEKCSLIADCQKLLKGQRSGHHAFRRLLDRHYKNGFHEMLDEDDLPGAWPISMALYEPDSTQKSGQVQNGDNGNLNLGVVQWAQFVEHDLSKPVSQSMANGSPIECCNSNQNSLQPRYHHPACAPILSKLNGKYGRTNCLNYVRSALAVGSCNFGAAEQLNQATGYLDLSQLYGFTSAAERRMRTLRHGLLKSTSNGSHLKDLLPMTTDVEDEGHQHIYCAWGASANATCFAAGDSRVNSNPYSITIYTIFMRNHNRVAAELQQRNRDWSDEQLFQAAKAINVDIYRRVVMNEWLSAVLGARLAAEVKATPPLATGQRPSEVSNEFGVAAIRFYFSMLSNELHDLTKEGDEETKINRVLPLTDLFVLKDELYKPQLQYTAKKLDEILHSLLNQRAMKMDASYVGGIVWPEKSKPTHADILAFDIQRGRDHGLQPYYKYLEACSNILKVTDWHNFEAVIPKDVLDKLKSIYQSWTDVDLIVGGISEHTTNGAVGPTFSCILSEQFSRVHQRHQQEQSPLPDSLLKTYRGINGTQLLCLNSELKSVPQNIFQLLSVKNRMIKCDEIV